MQCKRVEHQLFRLICQHGTWTNHTDEGLDCVHGIVFLGTDTTAVVGKHAAPSIVR